MKLVQHVHDVRDYYGNILQLPFVSLFCYLHGLLELSKVLSEYKSSFGEDSSFPKVILYLAAAVSDFYLPRADMTEHKIQSRDFAGQGLRLDLYNTPKILKGVRGLAPNVIMVTFKLETDATLLEEKALKSMKEYGCDFVLANTLANHLFEVMLYRKEGHKMLIQSSSAHKFVEDYIVQALVKE